MYKQIIETCEQKPIVIDDDVLHYMKDEFMMKSCAEIVEKLMGSGMSIDSVCKYVKDYQRKYIAVDKEDKKLSKHVTVEYWSKDIMNK